MGAQSTWGGMELGFESERIWCSHGQHAGMQGCSCPSQGEVGDAWIGEQVDGRVQMPGSAQGAAQFGEGLKGSAWGQILCFQL